MKPFTLWTRNVRFARCPINNHYFYAIVLEAHAVHTGNWIGVQPQDNVGLYSSYLRFLSRDYRTPRYGLPDYIVT